jgi:hypothetical protein
MSDLEPDAYLASGRLLQEADFFVYRAFLVPSEVSHWWYVYFPEYSGGFAGAGDYSYARRLRPGFEHPSNQLGKFAFLARHPKHYLETIRAYASADADAYGRFGIFGVLVVSVLLFLLRSSVALMRTPGFWSSYACFCFLLLLGLTLPSGSLFAILLAQGVGPFYILIVALYFLSRRQPVRHPCPT